MVTGEADKGQASPIVAVLIPAGVREEILSPEAERQLASIAEIQSPTGTEGLTIHLEELLENAVACITGWGTPPLSEDLLVTHSTLQFVAHTAGSVRHLVPLSAFERGLRLSHAAPIIADAVAEFVIGQVLGSLRQLYGVDQRMKLGEGWKALSEQYHGRLLGAQTIGVVGSGYVGELVIRLFKAFGCDVLVYDPFLTEERAATLRVETSTLDNLFARADVVTVHAPVLPETRGMIGRAQLAHLRDGALFINTARAILVDEGALLNELRDGRFTAVLDVFDQEPLSEAHPFRGMPNVLLSPHIAGHTTDTHRRQGQAMVNEVRRFLSGEQLQYEVTPAVLARMA